MIHTLGIRTRWFVLSITLGLLAYPAVAQDDDIDGTYGEGNKSEGAYSINGTGVLADMFENAGCEIYYSRVLGRPTQRADVIVWAPDSFRLPSPKEVEVIEQWLQDKRGRTFIFIGRDYDATMDYWVEVTKDASDDEKTVLAFKLADVWGAHQVKRLQIQPDDDCGWFRMNASSTVRTIKSLQGDSSWLAGLNNGQFHLRVQSYFEFGDSDFTRSQRRYNFDYDVKLYRDEIPIVTEIRGSRFGQSSMLAIVNGSFLLNVPLVHHEHRKLAAKIIETCRHGSRVCFLESDYDDSENVPVVSGDPAPAMPPSIVTILQTWPFGIIQIHLIVHGIVYCFFRYPIFGKARKKYVVSTTIKDLNEQRSVSNFGRHVQALGDLLRRAGNEKFARNCVTQYQQRASQSETYQPHKRKKKLS